MNQGLGGGEIDEIKDLGGRWAWRYCVVGAYTLGLLCLLGVVTPLSLGNAFIPDNFLALKSALSKSV